MSRAAGEPYRERMLSLPRFLAHPAAADAVASADILSGLSLTAFFLEQHVFAHRPAPAAATRSLLPAARERLVAGFRRVAA